VELRHHPFMRRHGMCNWPPIWTNARKENNKTLRGEIGVLRYIHSNDRISNKCYIVIEHEKEHFVGSLIFDDIEFCRQISSLLQQHIGRSIEEIGDLDLSYTL
jgi:hypothetical protein